jgi:hypothetical protein
VSQDVLCIECGDELAVERAELGYRYCTKPGCQAAHHRGLTITTVGVNKSADDIVVADPDEVRRRGEAGEFGRKDAGLGLDYRHGTDRRSVGRRPSPSAARPTRPAAGPGWSPEQEKIVRLYHEMGLSPRQIVERARQNAPRLGLTDRLVVRILSASPRRTR